MIIQNLHKIFIQEKRIFVFAFLFSVFSYAQERVVDTTAVAEGKELRFEENFFDALTQKAIANYGKAIEKLETCNELIPNNKAVLFELSKNYFKLNRNYEALEYANQALVIEADNIWVLEHVVEIHKRLRDFKAAIKTQQKIAKKHPKKEKYLVYLHLQNRDRKSALQLMDELSKKKMLDRRLRNIQARLLKRAKKKSKVKEQVVVKNNEENIDLRTAFEKDKTFKSLKELLGELFKTKNTDLVSFSEQGLQLYPAQPLVYLMHGRGLIEQKNYKKAIRSLENGIDFVIDNKALENSFYKELVKAYKGLGDTKKSSLYQNKIK